MPRLIVSSIVALGLAFVFFLYGGSSASQFPAQPHTLRPQNTESPEDYADVTRPGAEAPIGTPRLLPLVTDMLEPAEIAEAREIALSDQRLSARLDGHRTNIVRANDCPDAGENCDLLGIFDYDAGVCVLVEVDTVKRAVRSTFDDWCAPSEQEMAEARLIAENDSAVEEVLKSDDNPVYIAARTVYPRAPEKGHRYIGVRWSLASGTATAEFIVDLTTQAVVTQ